jgi:hypothetical protein
MQLSALVIVSTPTLFINDGNRNNRGEKGPTSTLFCPFIFLVVVVVVVVVVM